MKDNIKNILLRNCDDNGILRLTLNDLDNKNALSELMIQKLINSMKKYVYLFGENINEGNVTQTELLGGKGANLAEMASIGLPVPPGFTISTEVCNYYYGHEKRYPKQLVKDVETGVRKIETQLGKRFGASKNPLLVSVRSGARDSMPGMMDTILNLGINHQTVEGL